MSAQHGRLCENSGKSGQSENRRSRRPMRTPCLAPQWPDHRPPCPAKTYKEWPPNKRVRGGVTQCRESTRSEEHTSELQSLMRISYAVFCLKKKKKQDAQQLHTPATKHNRNEP